MAAGSRFGFNLNLIAPPGRSSQGPNMNNGISGTTGSHGVVAPNGNIDPTLRDGQTASQIQRPAPGFALARFAGAGNDTAQGIEEEGDSNDEGSGDDECNASGCNDGDHESNAEDEDEEDEEGLDLQPNDAVFQDYEYDYHNYQHGIPEIPNDSALAGDTQGNPPGAQIS
jgi:hypothetical protein